jgi:riboflavin synthase
MFTGLVQAVGRVVEVKPQAAGVRITIDASALAPRPIRIGDSIAVGGACLTATAIEGGRFSADVSRETLSKTVAVAPGDEVNLETSLALGDSLGGHLVSGHVDGVGEVTRMTPVGESTELVLRAPLALARYLAVKGSVAVDGVSLTVNRVGDDADGCEISINLIPHTLLATTLRHLAPGRRVNLEIDMVARYVERMLSAPLSVPLSAPLSTPLSTPRSTTAPAAVQSPGGKSGAPAS